MKLELKHLAPYLPYDLKVMYNDEVWILFRKFVIVGDTDFKYKPILRPLSDLTEALKEIYQYASDVEIKKYEYALYVDYRLMGEKFNDSIYQRPLNFGACPQGIYQQLIERHFDVFGLIDKGLAIDINTITDKTK